MRVVRRAPLLRDFVARGFFAALVEREAAGLARAAEARELVPADFARVVVARFAVARFAVERLAVERFAVERFAVERFAVERDAVLRAPPDEPAPADPSSLHLPDITRCAASATASAMIAPSFVALDMTFVAACDAVSAASSPASRILRRAAGLALIAAAAAASPAASISLLIAAFAILSTVLFVEVDDFLEDELEERLLADFAIADLPVARERQTTGCNGSLMTLARLRYQYCRGGRSHKM